MSTEFRVYHFLPVTGSSESSPPDEDEDDDRVENAAQHTAHNSDDIQHNQGPGHVRALVIDTLGSPGECT